MSMDERNAYYLRFYGTLSDQAILDILKGPAIYDSCRSAAVDVLAGRGFDRESLLPYLREPHQSARAGDPDRYDSEEILADAIDILDDPSIDPF